jgi:hypothetical protein
MLGIQDTIEEFDPVRRRLVHLRPVAPFAVTYYRRGQAG